MKQAHLHKQRTRYSRRRQLIDAAKRRKKAIKYYHSIKQAGYTERQAAQQTAEKFQTSLSSIRRWEKLNRERGFRALLDESRRPHTIHFQISLEVKLLVVVIRTLLFWGERRISAELERREIATISHTSVNRIFQQYHLPTKVRHPKGKSDGLLRRRYRRRVANELWHPFCPFDTVSPAKRQAMYPPVYGGVGGVNSHSESVLLFRRMSCCFDESFRKFLVKATKRTIPKVPVSCCFCNQFRKFCKSNKNVETTKKVSVKRTRHLDFKGPLTLLNGQKVWLLVVIDDFSRFCLGVHVCESACADAVITAIHADFAQYGKPMEILTDNALAFTSVWQDSVGQLDAYLDSVGVEHKLISAYYPESNGKAEAFIKILSTECLKITEFADFQELETFVAQFVMYYNQYRAHGGVGYKPPVC